MLVSILGNDRIRDSDPFVDLPMVSTDQPHLLVSPGEDIDLSCNVEGQAFPNIRWFRGTEPVPTLWLVCCRYILYSQITRHRTNPRGHLLIRNAMEAEDGGNYTCVVESTVGSSSASVRLDIGSKTRLDFLDISNNIFKGNQRSNRSPRRNELNWDNQLSWNVKPMVHPHLRLGKIHEWFFPLQQDFVSPLFSWYQNNTQLLSPMVHRSTLTITDVQTHHAGIYTCLASNSFGNTTMNITLIVTSRFTSTSLERITHLSSSETQFHISIRWAAHGYRF